MKRERKGERKREGMGEGEGEGDGKGKKRMGWERGREKVLRKKGRRTKINKERTEMNSPFSFSLFRFVCFPTKKRTKKCQKNLFFGKKKRGKKQKILPEKKKKNQKNQKNFVFHQGVWFFNDSIVFLVIPNDPV